MERPKYDGKHPQRYLEQALQYRLARFLSVPQVRWKPTDLAHMVEFVCGVATERMNQLYRSGKTADDKLESEALATAQSAVVQLSPWAPQLRQTLQDTVRQHREALQRIPPPQIQPVGPAAPKKKHGPASDMKKHRVIENVATKYGPNWKPSLKLIGRELDRKKIPAPSCWAQRKGPKATNWTMAAHNLAGLMIKAIEHSLKQARQ